MDKVQMKYEELEQIADQRKIISDRIDKLEKTILSDKGKEVLKKVHAARVNYVKDQDKFLELLKADKKALVVDSRGNDKLEKSIRNVAAHQFLPPEGVNVYDLLRHDHLVLSKAAVKELEARCLKS